MTRQIRDWMDAASCCEGPRPAVRFADLPRPYQRELLRLTAAAATSIAFFVALVVVHRTLASRSLASRVALLDPPARTTLLDPPARTPTLDVHRSGRLASRSQSARLQQPPSYTYVAIDAPPEFMAVDAPPTPQPARSRNPLSRFVRAVVHVSAAIASSPDPR